MGDFSAFKPMLAKPIDWNNKNMIKSLTGVLFLQPKLDGIRCCAYIDEDGRAVLQSRQGKVFKGHAMDELRLEIEELYEEGLLLKDEVLDGELYVHGMGFNEIQSLVTDWKSPYDVDKQCRYNVYDMYVGSNPSLGFGDRRVKFKNKLGVSRAKEDSYITKVQYIIVDMTYSNVLGIKDTLTKFHNKFVEEGYEGLIIRTAHGAYGIGKRPNDLIKMKEFKDEEYEIIDIQEGIGKNVGIPTLTLKLKESDIVNVKNSTFNAVLNGSEGYRREVWQNKEKYIGCQCTVKFFEKSSDNIPRFPVVISIRDYE